MNKREFLRLIAASVFAANIWASIGAAAPLTVDEHGLALTGEAQQTYIEEKLRPIFHPKPGAVLSDVYKFEAPDGWTWDKFDMRGVSVERLKADKAETKRVILQLHGGGYVDGMNDGYRLMGAKQAILARAAEIWYVNYRLAPEHLYPAALEDAAEVYRGLLNRGVKPENLIVIGDSAGGNLALELFLYLRENNLPQPKVMILQSPWMTLENNLPSRAENLERDLVLGLKGSPIYREIPNPTYGKGHRLNDSRLSPLNADLSGLPPTLVQVGGYELFLSEGTAFADKAAKENLRLTLSVYPGMPHDFALCIPELDESAKSLVEIRDFIERNM